MMETFGSGHSCAVPWEWRNRDGGGVLTSSCYDRLSLGVELFGNTATVPNGRPDFAFNVGGTLKLSDRLNFIFTGGRDFVGDTHANIGCFPIARDSHRNIELELQLRQSIVEIE